MHEEKHKLEYPQQKDIAVQQKLLDWYLDVKRDLPWRRDQDPYRIWVSEIMLQQTRVDTVIPYYERFMEKFPTLIDLAAASEEEVLKAWEGLGYYSRARNLHSAVKEVAATYGGVVPDDYESISKLKGVGPYTAGAILSIAYNQPVPAVDGNVFRVMTRLYAIDLDITKITTRRKVEQLVLRLIPKNNPGDFNQALMELGALICTPTSPACQKCPLNENCSALQQGRVEEFPIKSKAKPPVATPVIIGWFRQGKKVLVLRRPKEGLLANMWSFPTVSYFKGNRSPAEIIYQYSREQGLVIAPGPVIGRFTHIFSHRRWEVTVVDVEVKQVSSNLSSRWQWVTEEELAELALPRVYQKVWELIGR